ncbi:hexose carrier protein [Hortaea werneckii]|nr:hexose carrier protein [Hortaea werneckii]KAI6986618.1 hexose carrier protein [Hortaea werneckii]KAI7140740.1 hexose carrier protein [Hortaea werneckii]KAI7167738.1 hexose carrier protein [Hortaea werneckii]
MSAPKVNASDEDAIKVEDRGATTSGAEYPLDQSVTKLAGDVAYGPKGVRGIFSSGPFILSTAFLASLGGFSFGYDQGVISIINVLPQFHAVIPRAATAFGKSFMTAMLLLGCFVGCWFFPYIMDRWSRKTALLVSAILFNIGGIMMTAAHDYGTLVAGRAIGGLGTGTLALGAPMYISEVSPPNLRGILLVLESVSIVSGVIISYWISYACKDIQSSAAWRIPFGLQLVSATILGTMIQFYPYSPRWLAMKGRTAESLASLCKLRRLPESDERVQTEYNGILAEVAFQTAVQERRHPGLQPGGLKLELAQWADLFHKKRWRRTAAGAGVMFFQQFQGVNAFIYYAPTLFRNIGQSEEMSLILSGVFNCFQLVGVIIAFALIDSWGRRPLAIYGALGNMVCYLIISALVGTYAGNWDNNESAGWACVAFAFLFITIFGASYSPLGWSLPPEVFPVSIRSKGVGLAVATTWLSNFVIGIAVPPMFEQIGYGTYVFFTIFCAMAAVWAFFLVPETKGKTLEQVDEAFNDNTGEEEQQVMQMLANQGRLGTNGEPPVK